MAGDWIKMRVWLCRDPRVIRMADHLAGEREFMNWLTDPVQRACDNSAYEHVTRNVIVSLCVTGLLVTWGTAREQGDRDGDDLVLAHANYDTIDGVSDIPCFGIAMAAVGWLKEDSSNGVIFPKFFKENETPEEKHKRQNAERQARHREKKAAEDAGESNVTGECDNNVTVTTEKRREELKDTDPNGSVVGTTVPPCPHQEIISLYHEALPMGTVVREWTPARSKTLQTRWREKPARQSLDWWRKFFTYVSDSEFLTGQAAPQPGRDPFVVSLEWLIAPKNFAKVIEGQYHRRAA